MWSTSRPSISLSPEPVARSNPRAKELGAILDSDFSFELDSDGLRMRDLLIRLRYLRTIRFG